MRMFLIVLFGLEMIILPVTESHADFVYCPQTPSASVTIIGAGSNPISINPSTQWRIKGVLIQQVFEGTNQPTQFISIDVFQETINEDPSILNDLDSIIIVGISSTAQLQEMKLSPSVPSPSKCPTPVLQTKKSP
jgi:hypothetical protein